MTSVPLLPAQQATLQEAMRVLLTPAAQPTLHDWQLSVNSAIEKVVGADLALFVTVQGGKSLTSSRETMRANEHIPYARGFDARIGYLRRQEEQTVWSRPSLWGEHLSEMLRSSYYHDLIKPERFFDCIGMSVRAAPPFDCLGSIHLAHDSERGPRFGQRGRALLWLLEPCFRVGFESAVRFFNLAETAGVPLGSSDTASAAEPVRTTPAWRSSLTRREREVIELLSRRRSNREIAEMIGVSPSTAKRHTENILGKLGLRSRYEVERIIRDD